MKAPRLGRARQGVVGLVMNIDIQRYTKVFSNTFKRLTTCIKKEHIVSIIFLLSIEPRTFSCDILEDREVKTSIRHSVGINVV